MWYMNGSNIFCKECGMTFYYINKIGYFYGDLLKRKVEYKY